MNAYIDNGLFNLKPDKQPVIFYHDGILLF